jgi:hypothetical protein
VVGAVALLLEQDPTLTADQVRLILRNTAVKDAFTGSVPNHDWGFGKLDVLAALNHQGFVINAGMNDAWVNADAPFQGLFITVFPVLKLVFVSWFTFDSVVPTSGTAVFGARDQRWVTSLGAYQGNRVVMNAELTSGGVFNGSVPTATQTPQYGTITIDFSNCNFAIVEYDFPSVGQTGSFPIKRVVESNVPLCLALSAE